MCGLIALIFVFATVGRLNPRVNHALLLIAAIGMLVIGANQTLTSLHAITSLYFDDLLVGGCINTVIDIPHWF